MCFIGTVEDRYYDIGGAESYHGKNRKILYQVVVVDQ
jgi:hypothetical protein